MKPAASKLVQHCLDLSKSKFGERDALVSGLMDTTNDDHFKWRLEFNARLITSLRERRVWPVKRWDCPWETERSDEDEDT